MERPPLHVETCAGRHTPLSRSGDARRRIQISDQEQGSRPREREAVSPRHLRRGKHAQHQEECEASCTREWGEALVAIGAGRHDHPDPQRDHEDKEQRDQEDDTELPHHRRSLTPRPVLPIGMTVDN